MHPAAPAGPSSLHDRQLPGREKSTERHVGLSTAAPLPLPCAPGGVAMADGYNKPSAPGPATTHDGGIQKGTNPGCDSKNLQWKDAV